MTDSPALVEVHILEMPLDVYREASEHSDELQREFALILGSDPSDGAEVPQRLLALIDQLRQRFQVFTVAQEAQLAEALQRGDPTVDLAYKVPADIRQAVIDLGALLDEADAFCREGDALLTLATPPQALAFRRWFLGEFVRQLDGEEPLTWREFLKKS